MKKKIVTMVFAAALTVGSAFAAFAGQWQQTGSQWKYQNDDGSYLTGWQWLDADGNNIAECYYLNSDGIMLANCTTPDNFTVNADGAWTVNGIVQTKVLNSSTSSSGNKEGTEVPRPEAPTQAQETEAPTEPPIQETQGNNGYYNDNGTPDISAIADGILAGDPAAHNAAQNADTGGNAIGNADWR